MATLRRGLLADQFCRWAWLPVAVAHLLVWVLLSIPAISGAELEGGGSPAAFVLGNLAALALASVVSLVPIKLLGWVAAGLRHRPVLRRAVVAAGVLLVYAVTVAWLLTYAFFAAWAYDH